MNMVRCAYRVVAAVAVAAVMAACGGKISAPDTAGFTLTRLFDTGIDDYVYTLNYIANAAPDGDAGNAIGYKWWNLACPALLTGGTRASAKFVSATGGGLRSPAPIQSITTVSTPSFDAGRPRRSDTHSGRRGSPS